MPGTAQREAVHADDAPIAVDLGAAAFDQLGHRSGGPLGPARQESLGPVRPAVPQRDETGGGDLEGEIAHPVGSETAHAVHSGGPIVVG